MQLSRRRRQADLERAASIARAHPLVDGTDSFEKTSFAVAERVHLFPTAVPRRSGRLQVSARHEVHWDEFGNPDGKPVVYLHGGPGGGSDPRHARFFDPRDYRVLTYDQRGCGRSRPMAEIEENTTWDLVEDLEKLRELMGVERWTVAGGSWGSTLALAYALHHPNRVQALILRGIFTFAHDEVTWLLKTGTRLFFPELWNDLLAPIPAEEHEDIAMAYYRRLTAPLNTANQVAGTLTAMDYARHWTRFECRVSCFVDDPSIDFACAKNEFAWPFARIETHYLVHHGFFPEDNYLLNRAHELADIPTSIIHGRYDMVCCPDNAARLAKRMPHASLEIVDHAGHSAFDSGISEALLRASKRHLTDL